MNSYMQDKYVGTLIGAAVGDALGAPFEFFPAEHVQRHLNKQPLEMRIFERGGQSFPAGFYTDDTAQTICLAESILERDFDLADQFSRYRKWLLRGYATPSGDRSYGVGQQTLRALMDERMPDIALLEGDDDFASGNGALMRCSPIGLAYYREPSKVKQYSLESCYLTHNNKIAAWCCIIQNSFLLAILNGATKESLVSYVYQMHPEMPSELSAMLEEDHRKLSAENLFVTGYSLDTLRIALWAFLTTDNFESAIEKSISVGHDTDTYACVTGALSGCFYGYPNIPESWRTRTMGHDHISRLSVKLYDFAHQVVRRNL